jgi:hypothetical protein
LNKETRFISNILFNKEINLDFFPKKNNHKFWDKFVKIGSSHYVIPALYFKLKERDFLKLLNTELVSYLEEIYNQNFNRNIELVKEVNEISHLLKSNNINHVFLKGAALVSSIYNESIGARMVGDIDILIAKDQIFNAQKLFQENNYKNLSKYVGLRGRHLQRLIHDNKDFAIELHHSLGYKKFLDKNYYELLNRKIVRNINILKWDDFLFHIILNFQSNDHGSLKANYSFRTLLDVFNITNLNPKMILEESIHVEKINLIMSRIQDLNYKHKSNLFFFNLRLDLKNWSLLYCFIENIIFNILISIKLNRNRIIEFIRIKEYRNHVLNKLGIIQ